MLVFGEGENDRQAIAHLIKALRPDSPHVVCKNDPIVLISREQVGRDTRSSTVTRIKQTVAASSVLNEVIAVVAHEDCDACEPSHEERAATIERELARAGVPNPIAAAAAFETETWWYLWPDAVQTVRDCWEPLKARNRDVGTWENTKERLRRELRSRDHDQRCPDYEESDAIKIASAVRSSGIVAQRANKSASFERFAAKISALDMPA